jgi:hypothetical protein
MIMFLLTIGVIIWGAFVALQLVALAFSKKEYTPTYHEMKYEEWRRQLDKGPIVEEENVDY